MGLAERAGDHEIRVVGEQRCRVADPGVVDEFGVGLVEYDDAGLGHGVEQRCDLGGRHDGAGRVVRVRHEGDLRAIGDRRRQGGQIVRLVTEWDPDLLGLDETGEQRVGLERRPAHRHLVTGSDVGEQDLLQDAGRSSADRDLADVDSEVRRKRGPQRAGTVIRVQVDVFDAFADRCCDRRQRAERCLVRGEFHRVGDAVFGNGVPQLTGRVDMRATRRWQGEVVRSRCESGSIAPCPPCPTLR